MKSINLGLDLQQGFLKSFLILEFFKMHATARIPFTLKNLPFQVLRTIVSSESILQLLVYAAAASPPSLLPVIKSPLQNTNMVSQVHAVLLMLSLSILVFSQSFLPANAAKNFVPDVCRETISYAGCMHALQSDPRAKTASNFMELAKIALELGLNNAIGSKAYIDGLLEKSHAAPIKKCSFWYEAVVGSFRSALTELEKDALTANYDVKIAADDAASCDNELASGGVKVPSISTRNNDVALYSNIGDVITNKL